MKSISILIFILLHQTLNGQLSYYELTQSAMETVDSEDSIAYRLAMDKFEQAFHTYPDSICSMGLYYASILADLIKDTDKANMYLTTLSELELDDNGNPGWSYVLDDFAEEDYKNLRKEKRWTILIDKATEGKKIFFENISNGEQEFFNFTEVGFKKNTPVKTLYENLKDHNPYLPKQRQDYSISVEIDDSTKTSYLVYLPADYDPKRKYSTLIYLHGNLMNSSLEEYQIASKVLEWRKFYTKHAAINEVILIFPAANRKYNWMTGKGFFMIPKIVKQLKAALNLDDNKIFVSGHSNGATGSFTYAMKRPTNFSGFYGFNTKPAVWKEGTYIENILNRSFINISTDQDYYYPPNANDSLNVLMNSIDADYKDHRFDGFPHWFPDFDESEPAYKIIFEDMMRRERNPFPDKITWEFEDDRYGSIDWLSEIKLDTLIEKQPWHRQLNFKILKELDYDENDSLITVDVDKKAFFFPRKSGKLIAEHQDNIFRVKTSRIKTFKILISPEMINLNKKVKVYVNEKLYFDEKVNFKKEFMLKNFEETKDRVQIWIDTITIKI